jgi:hypothetical protein
LRVDVAKSASHYLLYFLNVTFNATGTEYDIKISDGNVTMSNGGYYIRHRGTASQVQMVNSTNNRNWIFYPVTVD